MVTDRDIFASAKIFIDQHGDAAILEAMKKIHEFQIKGDEQGRECWNKIAWAIEFMQTPSYLTGDSIQ